MTQTTDIDLPLSGIKVLDFSQFLAGPACALRLADLGATVTKVERSHAGDACRQLSTADQWFGANSLLFHTINRDKDSVTADLKNKDDLAAVKILIEQADVMIHNFRPGVMERLGLGFTDVSQLNPRLVYGVVSGYGADGPWSKLPGQDLLVQARSGLVWLTGSLDDDPIPTGISIADITAGAHLAQGILAALIRTLRTGAGALVEVSLLASAMDLQFEQYTSYLNNERELPSRSAVNGANVYASAPYGVYKTSDGHLVIAMAPIGQLQTLLDLPALAAYADGDAHYTARDEIKVILRDALSTQTTHHWLDRLEPSGIWCAKVLNWNALDKSGALQALDIVQQVTGSDGASFATTTCPIRIDNTVLRGHRPAPELGAQGHITQTSQR